MLDIDKVVEEGTEETIRRFLNRSGDSTEALTATVQYKLVGELSTAIKTTGSTLHNASNALRDSTEKWRETLKTSIDDFRKSNERASKALTIATYVLAFVALVQAAIFAYPLLK